MSQKKHTLDMSVDELVTVIVGKFGGEIEISIMDAMAYGSGTLAIKVEDDKITLKAITPKEAELLEAETAGNG